MRIGGQFKLGAFQEIGIRLRQMTAERDAITSANGTALVVIKKAGVEAKFGEASYTQLNLRAVDENDPLELEAHQTGRLRGQQVKIINEIEGEGDGQESEDKAQDIVRRLSSI